MEAQENERILEEYRRWCRHCSKEQSMMSALKLLADEPEKIIDCFYQQLTFGTGGLRGKMGVGTARLNSYTISKITQGLAEFLIEQDKAEKGVVIAYDSRNNGREFAQTAAEVLAGNGIFVHLFSRFTPTPVLSFAVRELHCGAGICITASHNPAEYNGYKVYGSDGCQITADATAIQKKIDAVDVLGGAKYLPLAQARNLIHFVPEWVFDCFVAAVSKQAMPEEESPTPLHVVYTPLNGTGRECILRILKRIGVERVTLVPSQEWPDGNFPTCPYPNPEERAALAEGLKICSQVHPDLLLATDPDCDRVGVAVEDEGQYKLLTGNEIGILLFDFICRCRIGKNVMPKNPVAVTTIVSTTMADAVAERYGVELRRTLTGFKYIGEQIRLLEQAGQTERYIFGFEESYGYLSGFHVRDKDAVNASMLICQMARYYKGQGKTLWQAMKALYETYGYYRDHLLSVSLDGAEGISKIKALMERLRETPPKRLGGNTVTGVEDYLSALSSLPPSNVLAFSLCNGGKVLVRPSGTEPKVKAYLFLTGKTWAETVAKEAVLVKEVQKLIMS